ncbi:MAG: hypothetical protein ACKVJQ_04090 [Alphaproteobacteria bacterium]|jgi:hypothetical protein
MLEKPAFEAQYFHDQDSGEIADMRGFWPKANFRLFGHRLMLPVFTAFLALALSGCESTPPRAFPDLTFAHLSPINFKVGRIDISTRYIPPLKEPNVEHLAPVTPYGAIRSWGEHRLRAIGGDHVANLIILDSSIRAVPLKTTRGIKGLFLREQSLRYEGRASFLLEIRDSRGRQRAFLTVRSKYDGTAVEGTSIADREKIWFKIVDEMMKELNAQIQTGLPQHFGAYLAGN